MVTINLPFWLNGPEISRLQNACVTYWDLVENFLNWPLRQWDVLTCALPILDLIAFQRDIVRFGNEPEALFRRRVKFALINAQDAGSKAGFIRIFERLGIGFVEIVERSDPVDWDVILLFVSESQLSQNTVLLNNIIQHYGRTCRRYQLTILSPMQVSMPCFAVGHCYSYDIAGL